MPQVVSRDILSNLWFKQLFCTFSKFVTSQLQGLWRHNFNVCDVTTSMFVTSQLQCLWRHNFKVCDVTAWRSVTSSVLPLLQRVGGNFRISDQIFGASLERRFLAVSVLSTKKFYLYKRANFLLPKRRISHLCWIGIVTYQLPPRIWFSITYEP